VPQFIMKECLKRGIKTNLGYFYEWMDESMPQILGQKHPPQNKMLMTAFWAGRHHSNDMQKI